MPFLPRPAVCLCCGDGKVRLSLSETIMTLAHKTTGPFSIDQAWAMLTLRHTYRVAVLSVLVCHITPVGHLSLCAFAYYCRWPSKAVTFIENHDTGSTQNHWPFPADQVGAGYAYIMTHPGIPCVFWDHYFKWGQELHNSIRALAAVSALYQYAMLLHVLARKSYLCDDLSNSNGKGAAQ
eukprot:GHRR01030006.1.p1 GENE.GHRR01030006.1~~GHRR01030006.1.p1  ORF type:complete len:180 (-),score=10.02 GHRR01030006.1:406-945(-)